MYNQCANNLKVCVRCYTYNHSSYIEDALDGFCLQETNFPFVCAIVDDASTDGEQNVIRGYLERHFDIQDNSIVKNEETDDYSMTLVRHKTNHNCYFSVLFLKYNHYSIRKPKYLYIEEMLNCVQYIALCEGDDYWTDPCKLQKQVDYLEDHPKCGLVWAKAKKYYQETNSFKGTVGHVMSGYYDMFVNYGIAPMTCMYTKSAIEGYYDFVKGQKWLLGDSPLFLYIAHDHDIHFMDEVVGVYRVLKNSASHSTSYEQNVRFKNSTFDVVKFFCNKYGHPDFKKLESIHYSYLFNYAFNDGRYDTAKELYRQIPYPNIKNRLKRIISSNGLMRSIYSFLYHKYKACH